MNVRTVVAVAVVILLSLVCVKAGPDESNHSCCPPMGGAL